MNIVSNLISAVKVEQDKIRESLVTGHVINFETYQRLVGQFQGLDKSLEILNDLLKEKDDDN
jgi:hypothetical protein